MSLSSFGVGCTGHATETKDNPMSQRLGGRNDHERSSTLKITAQREEA